MTIDMKLIIQSRRELNRIISFTFIHLLPIKRVGLCGSSLHVQNITEEIFVRIKSERGMEKEIELNTTNRWLCGFEI